MANIIRFGGGTGSGSSSAGENTELEIIIRDFGDGRGIYKNEDASYIGDYAFYCCVGLTSVSFPNVDTISSYAFSGCEDLTSVDFPKLSTIYDNAFLDCTSLTSVTMGSPSKVVTLVNSNAFDGTPIADGNGVIYVNRHLIDSYKTATNWKQFANLFKEIY